MNSAAEEICEVKFTDSQYGDYVREYGKIIDYMLTYLIATIIHETIKTQINNYKMKHRENFKDINIVKQTTADDDVLQLIVNDNNRVFKLQVISRGDYINTKEYHGEIPLYNHQLKTRDKIDLFYNCSEGR